MKRKIGFLSGFFVVFIVISAVMLWSTGTILSVNETNENLSQNNTQEQSEDSKIDDNLSQEVNQEVSLDNFLFLGDSFTVLLTETIKEFNPNATVLGQIGVQPGYWNENFSVLPDSKDIDGVVLLIGVNGVTYDNNLPNKKRLIDSLVEKYSDKTIYVEKVFPVGENFTNANPDTFNAAIKSHNEEIENYCKKYDNVVFIDATKDLVTESGYLKYTKDGLHISSDYQDIFYLNIESAIKNSLRLSH